MRKKKCVVCREIFLPDRNFQKACCPSHAIEYAREAERKKRNREKKQQRSRDRKRLDELRPAKYWKGKAQRIFNTYIRLRDAALPCVSCSKPPGEGAKITGSSWDAGHYRSRASASHLAFDERNVHKQCVECNKHLSGNIVEYRKRLLVRLGEEELEALENDYRIKKWTVEELREIHDKYAALVKEQKAKI